MRRNLKQAYSYNLIPTASQIAQKNPELGKELGHEIAGKLLSEEKLIKNADAANLAIILLRTYTVPEAGVQIVAKDTVAPAQSSLLSEEEYKQLMQKRWMRSCPTPTNNQSPDAIWNLIPGLQSMGDQMERAINGSKAALEEESWEWRQQYARQPLQDYQNAINTNPVEAVLETIEKAPGEQLYIQLANREATKSCARQTNR